eukprot:10852808-Prorocentrum_lima.AAC.1
MEYVDDFVLCVSAQTAQGLLHSASASMAAVLDTMGLLALPVNIAPDKTACILKLVGTGCASLSSALPVAEFS